jgi:hypothetical protein
MKNIISIIVLCLLFSNVAFASTTKWYICDSCSFLQEKSKAETNAPYDPISYAYTIDLDNKTITKWIITTENNQRIAGSMALDSTTNTKFNEYKVVLEDAEVPFSISATESSSEFYSSFELVGNPTAMNDLATWFETNHFDPFDWDTSYFGTVVYSMKTRISDEFTLVTFNFDDTSMLRVNLANWNWTNSTLDFQYSYAEDENDDEVPTDPTEWYPTGPVNAYFEEYVVNNGLIPWDLDEMQRGTYDQSNPDHTYWVNCRWSTNHCGTQIGS